MLLYSDVLTGDEMFSDAFPMFVLRCSVRCASLLMSPYSKTVDDIVYEVNCQTITIKAGADVDIGLSFLSNIIFFQPDPTFYISL
jgi:hypothetical protein